MLENLPPHKHEYWVMEGMLPLGGGEIRRKVALLPKMECDAIIRMELPDVFWADLAGWIAWHPKGTSSQASLLRARDIVVEHFSDSIGGWKFHTCSAKRSTYARDYYRPGMVELPRREPCLVTFTHTLPRKIIKTGVYKSFGVPGIYFLGTEELVDTELELKEKDQVLQEKDQVLQEKDAELQRLRDLLKE